MSEWQTLPRAAVMEGDLVEGHGVITHCSFSMDLQYVMWRMGAEHRQRRTDVIANGKVLDAWDIWWDRSTTWLDAHEQVYVYGLVSDYRFMGTQAGVPE